MRFVAYVATALLVLAVLAGCASAPARVEAEVKPEEPPCLVADELHQFLQGVGAKPYAGGLTPTGSFVVWTDRQGRWAFVGYPSRWPGRACVVVTGGEWVGPVAVES